MPDTEKVALSAAEREAVCRSSANHAKTIAAVEKVLADRLAELSLPSAPEHGDD